MTRRRPADVDSAFYCVSSAEYFLGAVALVNSLRLQGHEQPIRMLDCGLTRSQRRTIATEVELHDAPGNSQPFELKTHLPLRRPADVMVLIDVDIIATRPLNSLIEAAAPGRLVAFENTPQRDVGGLGALLDLGRVRRQPYVCSGLLAVGRSTGTTVLELLADRQGLVEQSRAYFGAHERDYPLLYADQDVLNVILASAAVEPTSLHTLPAACAPMTPFQGVDLVDARRLEVSGPDGLRPFLLHHALCPKPWQRPVFDGVYTRLLRRLLVGEDLAVRVDRRSLPSWLSPGARGWMARRGGRVTRRLARARREGR